MATERQIAANQRNASRSTGPRTDQGKANSRVNALKHGMACESTGVEADQSPEFHARRDSWSARYRPSGDVETWALDRAVVASFRIERCERVMETVFDSTAERARLAWEQDRSLQAATLGSRLSSNPLLIALKLESTWQGVELMLDWWTRLDEALQAGEDWTEAQASLALDLLGVPRDFRTARTPIDDPEAGPPLPFRRNLIAEQVQRLEQLQDNALAPLDELDRKLALTGDTAMLSDRGKLVLRYEREAWRNYHQAIRELPAPQTPDPEPVLTPKPAPPRPRPRVEAQRETDDDRVRQAQAEIAREMRELGIEGYPPGLELYLAMNSIHGTNPISPAAGIDPGAGYPANLPPR